ncbi:BREX system P-loop protein BrxC [Lysinibacillus sp. Ag94]|uniref:BREX system P-loop protein BrxC n=1 Tax=Lysinibacillus sp. Ag94 TaxID=2936682 RepID=UPI00200C3CBA|nr:BREX system P-loop protein BrxC [Lysinibacillus sp. Ag94]UPW82655.1 BREX system P-loop protein BrxC [Lysinibacillus sp. Ag94]
MQLKQMFVKDIERDIRGVIKVAQTNEADIYQELDEYVVTKELHTHFSKFYENYLKGIHNNTDKMGVWISGFFGSGKSHFLKILAYLLENSVVQGKKPVDFFEDKIKDALVYANMKRTADVETEVILFNIDSKSSLDNKLKEDAILRVFMKVFYEHRGYYGDIPGVAEMEKYLDQQGVYDAFKNEFESLAGEAWEQRRNSFYFDRDYVIGALVKANNMTEESASNWFDNGVNNFEISIEKFAKDVKEYVDSKGSNFHLVFLVDEIGQYIGDNRNLMLNLQTLTEDLGTYAQGKVWVMVTSQESIDSIIKVKGDDFSRIQGRFDTRLSLSSISVDEVIKKRILEKHPHIHDRLRADFPNKSAVLKNLISFKESTADLRGYADDVEFAEVYPFVPYQFKLLQNVFEQVRKHGSSGKHLSEGERSMLSAFKEAGLQYKDAEEGALIPFYAFYDTIKEFLNPSITRVIEGSKLNPALSDDLFNTDLLKVLFMIKYIKELPSNIDNIATLMVTHIDEDKLELKDKIKASLIKLTAQTLIGKNGDNYIFLTDDEQDINREIKQVSIEEEIVKREFSNYVFNDLYEDKRYSYSKQYAFAFNQMMDEKKHGSQSASIGIQVLSPLSDHYHKSEQELMMLSSGSSEIFVKLGGNDAYVDEMEEALRIEEYRKKKNPITQYPENIQNILNNKQVEARDRRRRVRELLEDAIKDATFYVNGDKLDVKGSSVKEKINSAFQHLIENVYTKLGYVKEFVEQEREIISVLSIDEQQVSFDEQMNVSPNALAKSEVMEFINFQEELQKQVRVKLVYDRFMEKPYGWKQLDIASFLAQLLKEQRIRIRYNSEYLEPGQDTNKLVTVFGKTSEADKGIITKRVKVDEALLRRAKSICREIFPPMDLADDEDGLIQAIRNSISQQVEEINQYKANYATGKKYPGLSLLDKGLEFFGQFTQQLDNVSFLTKLKNMEDDLADWKDNVSLVKSFFSTNQKDLFEQGVNGLATYEENKAYLVSNEVEEAMNMLRDIVQDPIPYKKIKDISNYLHVLNSEMRAVLVEKMDNAKEKLKADYDECALYAKQYGVTNETKQRIEMYYKDLNARLVHFEDIFKVDATISQSHSFKEKTLKDIQREITDWKRRKEEEQATIGAAEGPAEPQVVNEVEKLVVDVKRLVNIKILSSEEEVDQYINTLSNKLKQIIKANKQIEFMD